MRFFMTKEIAFPELWEFSFQNAREKRADVAEIDFNDFAVVPGCFDLMPQYYLQRGTGYYRTCVEIGGEVELYSEGLGLRGTIFWDKKIVAEIDAPFSKNTFRFDAGAEGCHELIIAVNNEIDTSASSLWQREYDFYAHGGIFRPLTLKRAEAVFAEQIMISTADIEKGEVEITVVFKGDVKNIAEAQVKFDNSLTVNKIKLSNGCGKAKFAVPAFKLWSPESPNLHKAVFKVGDVIFEQTFGIRKVEAKKGKLYLNGKELTLIGYNRHDAHPDFGYAVPRAVRLQDLQLLKAQGANCIRGCHYPQSEEFLNMCDTMGVLVWEESLGWGNREPSLTDPLFQERQVRETRKMALASINHPCIIIRGFLNEAYTHLESARVLVKKLADTLHEIDPAILVSMATCRCLTDVCLEYSDVIGFNTYPCWYSDCDDQFMNYDEFRRVIDALEEFASKDEYKDKPLIISEIGAEALPNLRGGQRWSEEYQADLLETMVRHVIENDRFCGTFLWQFCDTRTFIDRTTQSKAGNFNFKGALDRHRVPKEAWRRISKYLESINFKKTSR